MGFMVAVRTGIWRLINDKVITDPKLAQEGEAFIEYTRSGHPLEKTNPLGPGFSTKADVDYVNHILDRFIEALSM